MKKNVSRLLAWPNGLKPEEIGEAKMGSAVVAQRSRQLSLDAYAFVRRYRPGDYVLGFADQTLIPVKALH